MSLRNAASGLRQAVNSKSGPVSRGIQYFSGIPLPLNQSTKRVSISPEATLLVAAYAEPLGLNIHSRAGTPIRIRAPERPIPRRRVRRESALMADILAAPSQKLLGGGNYNYKLLKPELRFPKGL